jgi:glycosyltransferase involved in cell wall biosynthesis
MSIDNTNKLMKDSCIAVVIPTFKVSNQILDTIKSIGPEVDHIIVVDDLCPEGSGKLVRAKSVDPRVEVLFHDNNLGVGGAMKTGYQRAKDLQADIVVKIDGDGQMDSSKIPEIVSHIFEGEADYVKGNRFFDIETVRSMPKMRILGNLTLSFFAKFSTGYWRVFDPNNGFTAISSTALSRIQLSKIDNRYFFESDMLFRLNLARAVVIDSPMPAIYGSERSNLKISRVLFEFPLKHLRNFMKRVAYTYYLRDFTLASLELPIGVTLTSFGLIFGLLNFEASREINQATAPGTLILISMCVLVGIQLILSFFSYDIDSSPTKPITKRR